jgi:hypothetical protein
MSKVRKGAHFFVEMGEEFVVKRPRSPHITEAVMMEIAERQNAVAHIEGVSPIEYRDGALIEPRALGETVGFIRHELSAEEKARIESERARIVREIAACGWKLQDVTDKNTVFDRSTGRVTLIDFVKMISLNEAERLNRERVDRKARRNVRRGSRVDGLEQRRSEARARRAQRRKERPK